MRSASLALCRAALAAVVSVAAAAVAAQAADTAAGSRSAPADATPSLAAAVPSASLPSPPLPSVSLAVTRTAPRADSSAAHMTWVPPSEPAPAFKLRERALQAQLIELPSQSPGGSPTRPHHALAFRSEAFRRFAHDGLGLDAERCLAPMVRLSTKLGRVAGGAGNSNATFWLLARCALR